MKFLMFIAVIIVFLSCTKTKVVIIPKTYPHSVVGNWSTTKTGKLPLTITNDSLRFGTEHFLKYATTSDTIYTYISENVFTPSYRYTISLFNDSLTLIPVYHFPVDTIIYTRIN
jgi:hypothetical protein